MYLVKRKIKIYVFVYLLSIKGIIDLTFTKLIKLIKLKTYQTYKTKIYFVYPSQGLHYRPQHPGCPWRALKIERKKFSPKIFKKNKKIKHFPVKGIHPILFDVASLKSPQERKRYNAKQLF